MNLSDEFNSNDNDNDNDIAQILSKKDINLKCFTILGINYTKNYNDLPINTQLKLLELCKLPNDILSDFYEVKLRSSAPEVYYQNKDNIQKKGQNEASNGTIPELIGETNQSIINVIEVPFTYLELTSDIYRETIFASSIKKYYTEGELTSNIEDEVLEFACKMYKSYEKFINNLSEDSPTVNKDRTSIINTNVKCMRELGFDNKYINKINNHYLNNFDIATAFEISVIIYSTREVIRKNMKNKVLYNLPETITQKIYNNSDNYESTLYECLKNAKITTPESRFLIDNISVIDENILRKMIVGFLDNANPSKTSERMKFFIDYKGKDINEIGLDNKLLVTRDYICYDYIMNEAEQQEFINLTKKRSCKVEELDKCMTEPIKRLRDLILKLK